VKLPSWRAFRPKSLAARLVVSAAAWCLVVLAIGGFGLSELYRESVLRTLDSDLEVVLDTLAGGVSVEAQAPLMTAPPTDPRYGVAFSGRYWQVALVDSAKTVRSPSLWDEELPLTEPMLVALRAAPGQTRFFNADGPNGQQMRIAAQLVVLKNTQIALIAATDMRPVLANARQFTATLAIALALLGIGLIAAVLLQVRLALAPLARVRGDIADVRRGRRAKLDEDYPTEITPLTTELNALLEHNREVVERARTHVGNLAHALKTPISVLLNEARGEQGRLADLVGRQAEAMSRNVEHYLQRAQAAAHAEAIGARTAVRPVLEDIARTLERLYGASKDLDLDVLAGTDVVFRGEKQDIEEMIGNLMDNACKYGRLRVVAQLTPPAGAGDPLKIDIEDDGPGLTPEQQELVLKRGTRLDESAPGAGLGLSIVSELARAYGGALHLGRGDLGGLKASLVLPSAD
jgi:signal transduction histidine kinase